MEYAAKLHAEIVRNDYRGVLFGSSTPTSRYTFEVKNPATLSRAFDGFCFSGGVPTMLVMLFPWWCYRKAALKFPTARTPSASGK